MTVNGRKHFVFWGESRVECKFLIWLIRMIQIAVNSTIIETLPSGVSKGELLSFLLLFIRKRATWSKTVYTAFLNSQWRRNVGSVLGCRYKVRNRGCMSNWEVFCSRSEWRGLGKNPGSLSMPCKGDAWARAKGVHHLRRTKCFKCGKIGPYRLQLLGRECT